MFHYDGGIKLTKADLALDFRRRQPRGFISHAHSDHIARHEWALATCETAALCRHRLGKNIRFRELPYGEAYQLGGTELRLYPAGHCLGSAMLWADDGAETFLYTGDFKLGPSLTSVEAELPHADTLITEATFGTPDYRLPPRDEIIDELLNAVRQSFAWGRTPVVHAYALGKSQEVTAILTANGFGVLQHPTIYEVSQVYEACGMKLGDHAKFDAEKLAGKVVVTLPRGMGGFRLAGLENPYSIAVTGWAMDPSTKYRLKVDLALPLSDHADFGELMEAARQVNPKRIYCTHGPAKFIRHLVEQLEEEGFNAAPLVPEKQKRLF